MFIATLSHNNKKALIITNWKYILFNCVTQKHSPHVFIFSSLSVVKEVVRNINIVLVITSETLLLVQKLIP